MTSIEIRPVRTARERRTLLTFPWRIYEDDPLWVPPLIPERARLIDPKRGAFFKRGGEAEFFIAWRDGKPVGTICAAEDGATNEVRGTQECVFGFKDTLALQRLSRLAEKVRQKGTIVIREADLAHWDDEIDRIHYLLNVSLAHLPDSSGWHRDAVESLVAPFREIADPELILFADVKGETVGWLPGISNLNEVFAYVNGLRYPWNYVSLLWRMRCQTESLTIKSVLVAPEYWRTGVAVLLFDEMAKRSRARGYKWIDLSITSEENPQPPLIGEHMGAKIYKRWRVYRLFI